MQQGSVTLWPLLLTCSSLNIYFVSIYIKELIKFVLGSYLDHHVTFQSTETTFQVSYSNYQ